MPSARWHDLVDIDTHQFSIEDGAFSGPFGAWRNDFGDSRVGVSPGELTVFPDRSSGNAPLTIELCEQAPDVDLALWSCAVETAISIRSAQVRLHELGGRKLQALEVPPGDYATMVLFGSLDTSAHDMSFGADHYAVLLWRGALRDVRIAKECPPRMKPERSPARTEAECFDLLSSSDPHARFVALADLARHGSERARAALAEQVTKSETERFLTVSAVNAAPVLHLDVASRFLSDPSLRVRRRILDVVHAGALDFELESIETIDIDTAYAIVNALGRDRALEQHASSVLSSLDGIAELLR
jgi:hypothetical protein